jgi:hypothetical protein
VYVACQSMDAARAFLQHVLAGVDGLLDTNHDGSCSRASSLRWWTVTRGGAGVANQAPSSSRPAQVRHRHGGPE